MLDFRGFLTCTCIARGTRYESSVELTTKVERAPRDTVSTSRRGRNGWHSPGCAMPAIAWLIWNRNSDVTSMFLFSFSDPHSTCRSDECETPFVYGFVISVFMLHCGFMPFTSCLDFCFTRSFFSPWFFAFFVIWNDVITDWATDHRRRRGDEKNNVFPFLSVFFLKAFLLGRWLSIFEAAPHRLAARRRSPFQEPTTPSYPRIKSVPCRFIFAHVRALKFC